MIYELIAYNTDSRYPQDVRYRTYTSSKRVAEIFNKIPKIQFTDSGHGIVFSAREKEKGIRYPERRELWDYVSKHTTRISAAEAKPKRVSKVKELEAEVLDLKKKNAALEGDEGEIADLRAKLDKATEALRIISDIGTKGCMHIGDTNYFTEEATVAKKALTEIGDKW